ncbi:uncharacterized protein G2W53_021308 [Senna tora]|uniref:Uncharacterized protein n=1 Tax=Senna tora TaxID=362788 RepID=A0A834TL70_9FABA|nr:uncharacterized protein G2W53_021308 [Senna tora]
MDYRRKWRNGSAREGACRKGASGERWRVMIERMSGWE